ncbi:MAG: hypothetical protein WBN09_10180 [Woeseiaceae bacterium]
MLLVNRFRQSQANRILIVSFVIISAEKIDRLFQMLGGVEAFPMFAFIFILVQWLPTTSLYFFVTAKLNGEFEGGTLRVAPLWDDLSPNNGGLVLASTDFAAELTITYVDVPEFSGTGANNFSVTPHSDGQVDFDYGSVTATDGLVGVTPGNGATSMPVDFSAVGGGDVVASLVDLFGFGNPYVRSH